ncbi:response regulator [Paracoccus acridae]|uniref:Response regulator n=1 Tax=Paracoccus acridae TaxID=1795310 RepID=A0ABQ1VMM9_9RHOB|nr:response regulator [Paracoccus acridae]GGF80996.1 response regulator [Paracoccus acridae]
MTSNPTLAGRRILIVEDDFVIAHDFATMIGQAGATVIGPVGTLLEAMKLIERTGHLDGAILDINLGGEMVYDLVDALQAQGVPVVFATGYDPAAIPARYASVPLCQKPIDPEQIARAIFG